MANGYVHLAREIHGRWITFETHPKPHLDEFWSMRMIECHATTAWLDQHAVENMIQLGVGGGEFDEHGQNLTERTDCCATLVAKSLGLDNDPAYDQILTWLHGADSQGSAHPFDIYTAVKDMNELLPDDPMKVYAWANLFMAAKESAQRDFVRSLSAVKAALSAQQIVTVMNNQAPEGNRELNILIVESDAGMVMKAAVKLMKTRLAVVIQRQPNGSVQIYTNKVTGASLRNVIRLLRIAELRRLESPVDLDNTGQARLPGSINLVPEWFYFYDGEQIFNRSRTNTEAPLTGLTTKVIADCVRQGLDEHFNPRSKPRAKRPTAATA